MAIGQSIAGGLAYRNNKVAQTHTDRANRALTQRMEQGAADLTAYRPGAAEARMRALRARLGIASPLNDLTGEITGRPAQDLSVYGTSPLPMQPLPSQTSIYGADGNIDTARLQANGVNPGNPDALAKLTSIYGSQDNIPEDKLKANGITLGAPSAQSQLAAKLQSYGYNVPPQQQGKK